MYGALQQKGTKKKGTSVVNWVFWRLPWLTSWGMLWGGTGLTLADFCMALGKSSASGIALPLCPHFSSLGPGLSERGSIGHGRVAVLLLEGAAEV